MTIKEVEEQVGIKKTNIRYYEEAGLITPDRDRENNYRSYSTEDVELLKKIKFLRSIDVSVADIKRLRQEEITMSALMETYIRKFSKEKEEKEKAEEICRQIKKAGMSFGSLELSGVHAEDFWEAKGGDIMKTDRIREVSKLQAKDQKVVDFMETAGAIFLGLSIVLLGAGYKWPVAVTILAAAVMIGAHVVRYRIRKKIHGLQK
nr:MerR family transcriptional regulator [uncultured Merdimonas sp.]